MQGAHEHRTLNEFSTHEVKRSCETKRPPTTSDRQPESRMPEEEKTSQIQAYF